MINDYSFGVLRTNPKLTTNVKLVVSSDDSLYLNSIDGVNTTISSSQYKNVKVNPNSLYQFDLFKFWNSGKTGKEYTFDVFPYDKYTIKSDFSDQYEEVYSYGCEINKNKGNKEEFAFFAPIWLNKNIPDRFVIFKIPNNHFTSFDEIINDSEIVTSFDLRTSNIGNYLKNYISQEQFPTDPLFVDYNQYRFMKYCGISLSKGGFVNSSEVVQDNLEKDQPQILFESFITKGFERTNTAVANLINLEFLFDDNSPTYQMNRYFGLYVNEFKDGNGNIIGYSYNNQINSVNLQFDNSVYESTIQQTNSIYYLKDINNKIHKIKSNEPFVNTELNLIINESETGNIVAFKPTEFSTKGYQIKSRGHKYAIIEILGNPIHTNYVTIGIDDYQHRLYATNTLLKGTYNLNYFSNLGTQSDVAHALLSAIKNIGDDNISAVLKEPTQIVVYCAFEGTNNQYQSILTSELIEDTAFKLWNKGNFTGDYNVINNKIAIDIQYKDYIESKLGSIYVLTDSGYKIVTNIYSYLDSPEKNVTDLVDIYRYINSLFVIEIDGIPILDASSKIHITEKYLPEYGRLSIIPIKDFDFDFFSTEYNNNDWNSFYEKMFFTNLSGTIFTQLNSYINSNNSASSTVIISGSPKQINYPLVNSNHGFSYLIALNTMNNIIDNEFNGNKNTPLLSSYSTFLQTIKDEMISFIWTNFSVVFDIKLENDRNNNLKFNQSKSIQPIEALFSKENLDGTITDSITNEYDRLKENYTKYYSVESRVIPFINKWVKDGINIKDTDYRFNTNLAFGIDNMSPSFVIKNPTPQHYTHEWYYLSEYPSGSGGILDNFVSVISSEGTDVNTFDFTKIRGFFNYSFNLDDYINSNFDYFTRFFTVEDIPYTESSVSKDRYITPIFRFSEFSQKVDSDFSDTFFRGVKVYSKELRSKTNISYNVNNLDYIVSNKFEGYKFSAILVPVYSKYDIAFTGSTITGISVENDAYKYKNIEYKVVRNDKYKNILLYIQVKIPYATNIQIDKPIVLDYNILYNLKSFAAPSSVYPAIYLPTPLSGSLNLSSPIGTNQFNGIKNNLNTQPDFNNELYKNESGVYSGGILVVAPDANNVLNVLKYKINSIKSVDALDVITTTGFTTIVPPIYTSDDDFRKTVMFSETGGKNYFTNLFSKISFAHIAELINQGSPEIEYITIDSNGSINNDGTTDWILQFEQPDQMYKQITIDTITDNDKPNSLLILNTVIGYDFDQTNQSSVLINRYRGWYQPKFRDTIAFTDIGLSENEKDYNLQFDFNNPNFGIIKNYFYNKTNIESSNNILSILTDQYKSVYPLVDEVAIDKIDFNTFKTNWDSDYFTKNITKKNKINIPFSFNHIESKTFFGSKNFTVPELFVIDSFDLSQVAVNYDSDSKQLTLDINVEKIIVDYLIYHGLGAYFDLYINYTNIKEKTRYDFLYNYIKENIIPRYFIGSVELYQLKTNIKKPYAIFNYTLTNDIALKNGFELVKNNIINRVGNSDYNVELINNSGNDAIYNYYSLRIKVAKNKYRF